MDWTVQTKDGQGNWCDPIDSLGPEILSITGGLYDSIAMMEVTFKDGSKNLYAKKEKEVVEEGRLSDDK